MRVAFDLDDDVAALIYQRVENGDYADATDVVRKALHLLEERERLHFVRDALAAASAQYDRGE